MQDEIVIPLKPLEGVPCPDCHGLGRHLDGSVSIGRRTKSGSGQPQSAATAKAKAGCELSHLRMTMSKGNKHGGRKTRIKNYKKTKHYRLAQEAKAQRRRKRGA